MNIECCSTVLFHHLLQSWEVDIESFLGLHGPLGCVCVCVEKKKWLLEISIQIVKIEKAGKIGKTKITARSLQWGQLAAVSACRGSVNV